MSYNAQLPEPIGRGSQRSFHLSCRTLRWPCSSIETASPSSWIFSARARRYGSIDRPRIPATGCPETTSTTGASAASIIVGTIYIDRKRDVGGKRGEGRVNL